MLHSQQENIRDYCANKVISLHRQGIATIPLQGKRPSFSTRWKRFQHHLPDAETIQRWIRKGFESYGIVCGKVSDGLTVIDFDKPQLYEDFCKRFPTLCDSYTVATRRGFHVYLRAAFPIAGRRLRGCDIKGDGGYVVGAGSLVDGFHYRLHIDGDKKALSYRLYHELIAWLSPSGRQDREQTSLSTDSPDLGSTYCQLAAKLGRNNALYEVARQARVRGLSLKEAINSLAPIHAATKASHPHRHEDIHERLTEAKCTIKSAYTANKQPRSAATGLPNAIRETLLQVQRSSIGARLLDAVRHFKKGIKFLTGSQLLDVAKRCRMSKKSLMRVLAGDLAKVAGKRFFKRFDFDTIPSLASQGDNGKPNVKVGRKTRYIYRIPATKYLCKILQCDKGHSDTLHEADLCSAAGYRQALHRELIRRLSTVVSVACLASRLGVHRRTIFRYNVALGVVVTPRISRQKLTLSTLKTLREPCADEGSFTPGMWLQTQAGKRFPAIKSIAERFLRFGIDLCRQLPSRYTLPTSLASGLEALRLPEHLRGRGHLLSYNRVHEVLPPDWATSKYELGGYLAVYNGYRWCFKPPLRVIAYALTKQYEDGLVYYVKPLKV